MAYDFDRVIERRRTESSKWRKFEPDVLPLWVADMDFPAPEPVLRALRERVALNDGKTFGTGGDGFVRLNFACPRSTLTEALERMRQALEKARA
ncbi:MAG: hypothetical protein HYS36_12480 [Candidatus Rokubacteria bacterium]|nr:hypothetical protein [Candidatus Rokubacteria bacterium]